MSDISTQLAAIVELLQQIAENTKKPKRSSPAKRKAFVPPTQDDVKAYAKERDRMDLADRFYEHYTLGNWKDAGNNKVQNWKQKFCTWCNRNPKPQEQQGMIQWE
jgi:hypothetical protein